MECLITTELHWHSLESKCWHVKCPHTEELGKNMAKEHHQCHKVLVKKTKGMRVPPKVKFHPEKHCMPTDSSTDRISQAAKQLTHALQNPAPSTPFEHVGNDEVVALNKLADIFQHKAETSPNKDTPEQRVPVPEQRVPMPVQRVVKSNKTKSKKEKIKDKKNPTLPLKPNRKEMEKLMINIVKQTKN